MRLRRGALFVVQESSIGEFAQIPDLDGRPFDYRQCQVKERLVIVYGFLRKGRGRCSPQTPTAQTPKASGGGRARSARRAVDSNQRF